MQVTFGTLMAIGFLASPIMLAWGWIRFAKLPRLGTVGSVLSLIGLILTTASAALAVSSIGYAYRVRRRDSRLSILRSSPHENIPLGNLSLSWRDRSWNRRHWKTDFTGLGRPKFRRRESCIFDRCGVSVFN